LLKIKATASKINFYHSKQEKIHTIAQILIFFSEPAIAIKAVAPPGCNVLVILHKTIDRTETASGAVSKYIGTIVICTAQ
jgi:hypothetical protein